MPHYVCFMATDDSRYTIFASSGGNFGEPRDTYFDCDLPPDKDRYPDTLSDFDAKIVQASRSDHPGVLCIMTATDERLKNVPVFEAALKERFRRVNATAHMMMLTYYAPDDAHVEADIAAADIIYVSGGTSHLLNPTLKRRRVDRLLAGAAANGTILAGLSAGLCCWFSHINSGVVPGHAMTVEGLGWFRALIAPHWDTEPFREEPFRQMLADNPGLVGLAFDEHTGIEIRDDHFRLHEFGPGGYVRHLVHHQTENGGGHTFKPLAMTSEFAPLSSLGVEDLRVP